MKMKNKTSRFLIVSFLLLIIISACIFFFLMDRMARKNRNTTMEVGGFYMERMSVQISKHFQTAMDIKLSQVESIIKTMPPGGPLKGQELLESMAISAAAREFEFLGLVDADGNMERILGEDVTIADEALFFGSLKKGEKRIAAASAPGVDAGVVLLGVPCQYDMKNGQKSIALVGGIDSSYIYKTLSLNDEDDDVGSFIIRENGDIVIKGNAAGWDNYFDYLDTAVDEADAGGAEDYIKNIEDAIDSGSLYSGVMSMEDGNKCVYGTPLTYSKWYLVTVMSYDALDGIISSLDDERMLNYLEALVMMCLVFIILFLLYLRMTNQQVAEIEKARNEALKANKAKSEFLSNMSHDIRTPMNAIVGMTAIASANIEDKKQLENCLKKITLSSRHLLGLINDILDMSKIESGKMTLNIELVSLRETVESMASIIQSQFKAKNQQFDISIANILSEYIYCDSVRLNQVLLNFMSNAYKFTPEGGSIHIRISQEQSPMGEEFARTHFRIRDTGIGMTPEFQKKVFDSFEREDNLRVHKTEGTGLGMAINKHIVDAMGGIIEIDSELDKGTEFHVIFDLERGEAEGREQVLPSWNVLLIGTDEQICVDTVTNLVDLTVKCHLAKNRAAAMGMLAERQGKTDGYQMVLIEEEAGNIDGTELAKEIHQRFGQELPVVLLTEYNWDIAKQKTDMLSEEVSGIVCKPLFKSTLYQGLLPVMKPAERKREEHKKEKMDFHGIRLLVAEDNDLNYEVASALLTEIGIETEWAQNGKICVDMFQASSEGYYDAILMDIRMPIMSGYEAAPQIRKSGHPDAGLPIIAMTADAFSDDVKKCYECGMDAHTSKPIDMEVLTRLLSRYLYNNE